jgi:small-conductance mechanosensitive channel
VEYARNQGKIERLSHKLQELYEHFQEQSGRLEAGRRRREQLQRVQSENTQLEEDIRKVRELLQGSLLEEEKARLPRQFSELH